jgi:hypothetical protein
MRISTFTRLLGREWIPALADAAKRLPWGHRDVKIRLFREFDALRAYQVDCRGKIRGKS